MRPFARRPVWCRCTEPQPVAVQAVEDLECELRLMKDEVVNPFSKSVRAMRELREDVLRRRTRDDVFEGMFHLSGLEFVLGTMYDFARARGMFKYRSTPLQGAALRGSS